MTSSHSIDRIFPVLTSTLFPGTTGDWTNARRACAAASQPPLSPTPSWTGGSCLRSTGMTRFATIYVANRRKTLTTRMVECRHPSSEVPLNLLRKEGRERVEVFDLVVVLNKDWQDPSTNAILFRLFVKRSDPQNVQAAFRRHHQRFLDEMISGRPLLLPQKQTTFEIPVLFVVDASREGAEGVSVSVLSQSLMWVWSHCRQMRLFWRQPSHPQPEVWNWPSLLGP